MNVSVIIPTYHEPRIVEALESVLQQVGVTTECIVVDGAQTPEGFPATLLNHPSITFIHEADTGVYDAINKGIARAKGDWILVLGANDKLATAEVLAELLKHSNAISLIHGNANYISKTHSLTPWISTTQFDGSLYWRHRMHQQAVLYHRSLFKNETFNTAYKILGDYDFHLRLLKSGISSMYVDVLVSECDGDGLSKNFHWKLYSEELKIKKQHLPTWAYACNVMWVPMKFLVKKLIR